LKRVFIVVLIVALLLIGCGRQNSEANIQANEITIFYGFSSYAMFGADQKVIDDLLNQFNSLSFEKTSDEMDFISAFNVNFSYNGNNVQSFRVDKNGIFKLNGETQCYKVSSGSFDYDHLETIYKDSQRKELG